MTKTGSAFLGLLATISLLPLAVQAAQVQEFELENGMKVIVKEDHRAPIAVSQVWYKVGSSYEPEGQTGISHVLEHLMFKGTERYGPNEFSKIISENGGRENAFTGRDYTAYFQTLSSDRLNIAFDLEADRMRNLLLDEEEFQKERDVVTEERRLRTEDKPTSLTYEQFNAVAWRVLPYRRPIIGWMSDLENLKIEDLRAWYQRWYAPNNATLVVVGDVDAEKIHTMAQETFGKLPPSDLPVMNTPVEPAHNGVTRLQVKAPAKQPYLIMGFKAPVVTSVSEEAAWEPYALEALAAILDGGDSARLSRSLIRGSSIANSAGASYDAYTRLPGMMLFDGVPAEGRSIKDLEKALLSEIEKVKAEPVAADELKRVVTQTVASKVYEKDSVFYQAMQIGMLETVGLDWRLTDTYVEKLRAVTPEQVQEVAQRYLQPDNMTIAVLDPQPMDEKQAESKSRPHVGVKHGS
ncbi:peptidase M16 [Solemya elarraichensis gill symbiont]|uniref:Peptidase M16 n=2 Tax=Solemya elarraichensis gill symbiont TaxID=1918949 RepID=A0A1T2KZD1_9GAMM|nr:peptidase M16 [Solemya elarraichensis gill symbiont]